MRTKPLFLYLPLLLPALPSPVQKKGEAGEKISLCLNLKKGDRFHFRIVSDIDQSTKMGEMDMGSKVHTEQDFAVTVEEALEDGSVWVETRFGAIRGKMTAPMMGETEFDSAKEEEGAPMAAMTTKPLTALAGKSFRQRFATTCKILEVRGMAEAMKGVFDELGPGAEMVAQALAKTFSDEGMRKVMQAYFTMLPSEGVAVGGTWPAEADMALSGVGVEISFRGTNTLERADAETAVIGTSGTLATKEGGDAPAKQAEEGEMGAAMGEMMKGIKIEKGEMRASQTLSRKDGFPLGSTSESRFEMRMPIPMVEGEGMFMTQTMKIVLERVPAPAEPPATKPGAGK